MDNVEATERLVAELRAEAAAYRRQWITWLGLGGAGGMVALLSFAANLPQPDFALKVLLPSLAAFALSVLAAGPCLLISSEHTMSLASHYANASNRDELKSKIDGMPEMFSSPQHMADEYNAPRNRAIDKYNDFHRLAESAWSQTTVWLWGRRIMIAIASIGFLVGMTYPIYLVGTDVRLVPESDSRK